MALVAIQYDRGRRALDAQLRPPKTRVVDLRVGDDVLVEGRGRMAPGISTFYDREVSDEEAAAHVKKRMPRAS